jgi:sortase A
MKLARAIALCAALGASYCFAEVGYINAKASVAQLLLARSFDALRNHGKPSRPWPWADFQAVARVRIERIGLDVIALDNASPRHLAFGPTLSRITLSGGTLNLLNAHRDTHFAQLAQVRENDQITLETAGNTRRYRVRSTIITATPSIHFDNPAPGALALSTCWPFDAVNPHGPQRFVVLAEPINQLASLH